MNQVACIERSKGQFEEITAETLVQMAELPLQELNSMKQKSQDVLLKGLPGHAYAPHTRYTRSKGIKSQVPKENSLTENFSVHAYQKADLDTMNNRAEVKAFIEQLDTLIVRQLEVIIGAQEEGKIAPLRFVSSVSISTWGGSVAISRTLWATRCEDCGYLVPQAGLSNHQGTMKCMQATGERDVREAGWKTIVSSSHIAAIKAAGVELDIRPAAFNIWVPAWADKAIKQYEADESGYAGLKLAEYLKKMKP